MIRPGRPGTVGIGALLLAVALALPPVVYDPAAAAATTEATASATADMGWEDVPAAWPAPGPVTATAYVLMDAQTGQILAQREPDLRVAVASTVKVLTVLTALDYVSPDAVVTVGDEVQVGGAGVGLDPGERWLVEDLLEAIVVRSGNDAARALAVHVGGSMDGFVTLMQAKATELGLRAPVVEDPSGLDDSNRLSARELAVITRAAMADERFRAVAARAVADLPSLGTVETRNLLLERYAGATGVKTGYTDLAGWCLIGSAARDGRELIAVVLDARTDEDRFADAERLLDFGFLDHVAQPAPTRVRLRGAGRWVAHDFPLDHVWFPSDEPGSVDVLVPLELDGRTGVSATWQDRPIGRWEAAIGAGEADPGSHLVGARLVDGLYRAMRSAHRGGLWTAGPGVGG